MTISRILFKTTFYKLLILRDKPLLLWIFISMIPAGFIGLVYGEDLVNGFKKPFSVALAMILMAFLYFLINFIKRNKPSGSWHSAVIMGIGQAIAILPGISRSGITISLARIYGISFHEAAKYSFIMAVPIIFGAQVLSLFDLSNDGTLYAQWDIMLIGAILSFVTSYFSAKFMLDWCKKHGLNIFGIYLLIIGIIISILESNLL